jgi:hypothetical protein
MLDWKTLRVESHAISTKSDSAFLTLGKALVFTDLWEVVATSVALEAVAQNMMDHVSTQHVRVQPRASPGHYRLITLSLTPIKYV